MDIFHGEFAEARKKFFTGNGKTVRWAKGKLSRVSTESCRENLHAGLLLEKTAHKSVPSGNKKVALEESFDHKGGTMLVLQDFRALLLGACFR